ncbi:hypothetical protein Pcinc_043310 [Petrolisthes cinctipes]|uniref:Uncharacterized protein n=1 Tax=Petrolisthes cinctipes TaxID=88211 RepID=A0AAE1EG80_PETCI|nr:hypothetical protein Pcinc_043310 [Petrolisthes cinctipes]
MAAHSRPHNFSTTFHHASKTTITPIPLPHHQHHTHFTTPTPRFTTPTSTPLHITSPTPRPSHPHHACTTPTSPASHPHHAHTTIHHPQEKREEVQAGANFGIKSAAGDGFLRDLETGNAGVGWSDGWAVGVERSDELGVMLGK